jgi:hypothetical protein
MLVSHDSDVTAMRIHLNELRSRFDHAIREGESFTEMKEMHQQIRELESCIKVLEWNGSPFTGERNEEPASRVIRERKYRFVEDPPPLL